MFGYIGSALGFAAARWQWQPSPHNPFPPIEISNVAPVGPLPDIAAQLVPLSVPIRRASWHALHASLSRDPFPLPNPVVDVSFGWFVPLDQGQRRSASARHVTSQKAATDVLPDIAVAATVDYGWFVPLAPAPRRPGRQHLARTVAADVFPDIAVVTQDFIAWFNPLSEPVRARVMSRSEAVQRDISLPPTQIGWHMPMAEPRRSKELPRAAFPSVTWQGEPIVSFSWMAPLSEPQRRRELPLASRLNDLAYQANPVVPFHWFEPLRQPMAQPRRLPTALQPGQSLTLGFTVTAPLVHGWHVALAVPQRRTRSTAHMQGPGTGPLYVAPVTREFIDWFIAMAEPVRHKPALGAELQPPENTMHIRGNVPFASTGPLYLNNKGGRRQTSIWRGRPKG